MMMPLRLTRAVLTAMTLGLAATAAAQPLGTFTWQLQPFCNVVTVNLTQQGAVYTADGYDDQCGAAQRAPLVGLATTNPDGTIGLGLNIVTVPGGRGVQIDARVSLPSGSGPWSDSAGNSGSFAFAANTGGPPRPLPAAPTIVPAAIRLQVDGGVLAGGALGAGSIPAVGAGVRMMWQPGKAAFRAGAVEGVEWDDAYVGLYSTALGFGTIASGRSSTALGDQTQATGRNSTAIGRLSRASGADSTALGFNSLAIGSGSTALGTFATSKGDYSTALGLLAKANGGNSAAIGTSLTADGQSSFVMGVRAAASATANGSFVYGDQSTGISGDVITSISPNQFLVRAAGGVVFWSSPSTVYPTSPGVQLNSNASAWSSLSDVNSKENFHELADEDVLTRLALMPVREWNYKAEGASIRHIGPTAQDFRAAFGLGDDDRRISTIDADGVALAALRALEARTRAENELLRRDNDELRARLDRLERRLDPK